MSSPQKDKGSRFEREAASDLSVSGGSWKRIPGSGSLGTNLNISYLTGDLEGHYPWFGRAIKAENKYGYGTSQRMTILREWLIKVREQAGKDNKYPCLLLKFDSVTGGDIGSAKLICFNFDTWNRMMADLEELYTEHSSLLDKYMAEHANNG